MHKLQLSQQGGTDLREVEKAEPTATSVLYKFSDVAGIESAMTTGAPADIARGTSLPFEFKGVLDQQFKIASGTITPSDPVGTVLAHIHFPDELFNIPSIKRCIDSFGQFACDGVHLILRINSLPTQYFALLMATHPVGGFPLWADNVYSLSTFPSMEIKSARGGSAAMNIPFIYNNPIYQIAYSGGAWVGDPFAHVKIVVLNEIATTGNDPTVAASWTLWANFIKPRVHWPTGTTTLSSAIPGHVSKRLLAEQRMGDFVSVDEAEGMSAEDMDLMTKLWAKFAGISASTATPASPSAPLVETQQTYLSSGGEEAKAKEAAPNQMASVVNSAVGILENVPVVGTAVKAVDSLASSVGVSVGDAVSTAFDVGKKVFKWLGFAKPFDGRPAQPMANIVGNSYTFADSVAIETPLQWHVGAKLDTATPLMGAHQDEMSIDYIKSIPSLCYTGSMKASDTIWIPVHPMYTNNHDALLSWQPTILGALTDIFQWYNGGLKYRVSFVAPAFASGRLGIIFVPFDVSGAVPTGDYADYTMQYIVDLQQTTEVEFTVNYPMPSVWTWAHPTAASPEFYGSLYIVWKSDLVVSDATLDPGIGVNIYVAGAEDFNVAAAVVRNGAITSAGGGTKVQRQGRKLARSGRARNEAQSNIRADFQKPFEPLHQSMKQRVQVGLTMAGDSILSLKELVNCKAGYNFTLTPLSYLATFNMTFRPSTTNDPFQLHNTTGTSSFTTNPDASPFVMLARLFSYWRGGCRYCFYAGAPTTTPNFLWKAWLDADYDNDRYTSGGVPYVIASTKVRDLLEVEMPYWHRELFHFMDELHTSYDMNVHIEATPVNACLGTLFFSASDDFQCGFLHGPPTVDNVPAWYSIL
jgi:hypothetical protein